MPSIGTNQFIADTRFELTKQFGTSASCNFISPICAWYVRKATYPTYSVGKLSRTRSLNLTIEFMNSTASFALFCSIHKHKKKPLSNSVSHADSRRSLTPLLSCTLLLSYTWLTAWVSWAGRRRRPPPAPPAHSPTGSCSRWEVISLGVLVRVISLGVLAKVISLGVLA